jgi:transcriptional regulator with XRE-family HTH domain
MSSCVNVSTPQSVPAALARLNAVIDDVAKRPGWSYKRVATEAGIDVMTLHALRKGRTRYPDDRTCWGLDGVLGYEKGKGVQRILAGREPVLKDAEPEEADPTIAEIEATGLERGQKDVLIAVYLNQRAAAATGVIEQAREWEQEQRRQGA